MLEVDFCFALATPPRLVSVEGDVAAMLGFSREELLDAKVHFIHRVHAEDAGIAESLFSAAAQPATGAVNLRLRHADGRIRCFKARYARKRAGDRPHLQLSLVNARDVREPGDAFLVACFKSLLEHTTDAVYVKNRNHVILAASRSMPDFAVPAAQAGGLVGYTDYEVRTEADADCTYRLEKQTFAEGCPTNRIQQVQLRDGTQRWFDNRQYPINGPDGELAGVFGIAIDVTESIEAINELRASQNSLRLSQKIAGIGSYLLDIPSALWTSSETMDEIFGIDPSYERTTSSWLSLVHPNDRAAMKTYLEQEVVGQGKTFDREYRILRRNDGAERWVHGLGKLDFDAQGRPCTMHGTIKDITERKLAEAELRESAENLRTAQRIAGLGIHVQNLTAGTWNASDVLREILGVGPDDDLSLPAMLRLVHPDDRAALQDCFAPDALRQHPAFELEHRIVRQSDQALRWVRVIGNIETDPEGNAVRLRGTVQDITARKLAEERLRLAATVFTSAREGITITDPEGTILEVNEAFTRITGYTRDEVAGRNPRILQSGLHHAEFYKSMWSSLLRDGFWSGEIWNRKKNGDVFPETLSIHAIRDVQGQVQQYVALFSDISTAKEQEQQLHFIEYYDALTGLPNRTLFADRLRQAMEQAHRRAQPLAVACLDLDGFKSINDRYGRAVGDALLTALAFRLKRKLRPEDRLARLGGDEFAVMMPGLDHANAWAPALSRLLEAADEEMQIGDVPLRITASAGVTFYPQDEEMDADMLLRQAGLALYEAKLAGKNRYSVFDPGQDLIARSRHENIERIRRALAARQFVNFYQPKVNMRTGKVIGAEALLRWQHPERGILPPGHVSARH